MVSDFGWINVRQLPGEFRERHLTLFTFLSSFSSSGSLHQIQSGSTFSLFKKFLEEKFDNLKKKESNFLSKVF
jgi:hypothetical protein